MLTLLQNYTPCITKHNQIPSQINEVFGDKEDLEFEDLGKLVYLEQCIKETLRIHPPVIMTTRKNHHRPETVNNIHIPTGKFGWRGLPSAWKLFQEQYPEIKYCTGIAFWLCMS